QAPQGPSPATPTQSAGEGRRSRRSGPSKGRAKTARPRSSAHLKYSAELHRRLVETRLHLRAAPSGPMAAATCKPVLLRGADQRPSTDPQACPWGTYAVLG